MTTIDPAELARKRRRHRNERIVAAILIVLVAIAAGFAVRWNRREAERLRQDQSYIPRPLKITPEVTMLQELVRIDSSRPEGVAAAARWIAAYLKKHGIEAELIESAPSMINVYARIKGRSPGQALLLFNHLDVVPPGAGWTRPPFEPSFFGDRMYGRGTIDMKALTVCQLVAFVDVARSGRAPEHDLVFLATADEETGSRWGMQWLLERRPDVFEGVAYGVTEGGITEMMTDRMTYFGIEIGGKQMVRVLLAAPALANLQQARIALEPYMFSRRPERVLPEVRTFMKQLAPTRIAFKPYLADIDAAIRDGHFWRLPPTYRDLVQSSVTTVGPRQTASGWQMEVTMINLPDEEPDARIAWLRDIVAPHGVRVGDVLIKDGPARFSSHETPLFALLSAEARERYSVTAGVQILYRSASDCRFLRRRGITCYGISPYPVSYHQSLTIHAADEFISVGAFQDGVEYMQDVVRAWSTN